MTPSRRFFGWGAADDPRARAAFANRDFRRSVAPKLCFVAAVGLVAMASREVRSVEPPRAPVLPGSRATPGAPRSSAAAATLPSPPGPGTAKTGEAEERKGVPGEPGSEVPLASPLRGPDRARLAPPLPRRAASQRESDALRELEAMAQRYRAAYEAFAEGLSHVLVVEAQRDKVALEAIYQRKAAAHSAKAEHLRTRAIERYRAFLTRHPSHPTWSPEIGFRLAELQLEVSEERFARLEEAYEKALSAYLERPEKERSPEPPVSPVVDRSEAIASFLDVVTRFPAYPRNDAALYMAGTLLAEQEDFDRSREAYLALGCANRHSAPGVAEGRRGVSKKAPPQSREPALGPSSTSYEGCEPLRRESRYVGEAWLRLGELHYDLDELELATSAYERVASDPESELYDEALIRLAWTLYLRRDFPAAAQRLDAFILHADRERLAGVKEGAVTLRDLAVTYAAKTYLEEDWDQDGREDERIGLRRLERDYANRSGERHVPDIYAQLGDLLASTTDFAGAIEVWETALRRWPEAPAAPRLTHRIMSAYHALREPDRARAARDALATRYLRGTPWFLANENDSAAIAEAMALSEEALVGTAVDHHRLAQELRRADDPRAKDEYAIAADAYAAYLERFPDTPSAYEYRFQFAESLYYAGRFELAAAQYAEVRDSNLDDRLRSEAAEGVVLALEAHVEAEKSAKRLEVPAMPKEGTKGPFDPRPIPEALLRLIAAYDTHVKLIPDHPKSVTMAYLAGEIAQRYFHFEVSETRFSAILEAHCKKNVAINAGTAILDAYVVRGDLDGTRRWTQKLASLGCGEGDAATAFAGDLKTVGNAVRFREATLLYDSGDFEAAADRYVALVDEAPDDPNADRALNNAAVAYEKIGRFGSARSTYRRIYTRYPASPFADEALERFGYNNVKYFAFDEAVQAYLVLARDERYAKSDKRERALWNAADLLDNLQRYEESSTLFRNYAQQASDRAKRAEADFRAAKVLRKAGDPAKTLAAFEAFLQAHGDEADQAVRSVEAQLRVGQALAEMGQRAKAEEAFRKTVALFEARGLKVATDEADFPSEAQFLLAEFALRDVLDAKLTSTGKRLQAEGKQLTDRVIAASAAYDLVMPYRRLDWVLAAMYRKGYAFETMALKLRAAPVPRALKQYSEVWFAYKDEIDKYAKAFEDKALPLYLDTLKYSKQYAASNRFVDEARQRLNLYRPDEFPVLRPAAVELQLEDRR